MLQLTFLGTSSGTPTKFRNVSGLAVQCINPYLSGDKVNSKHHVPWVLIDCGEGTQHQLLQTPLSLHQLSVVCITHVHGDHCYGLPGLLSSMAMSGRSNALTLIAPKAIAKLLDTITLTTQLYFSFDIEFIAIEDILTNDGGVYPVRFSDTHSLSIEITELSHRVASYAFGLSQQLTYRQLDNAALLKSGILPSPVWGQLKKGKDVRLVEGDFDPKKGGQVGQVLQSKDFVSTISEQIKIVVSGDNDTPSLLTNAIKEAILLVHESTYTQAVADKIEARQVMSPQHSTAQQVATFADDSELPYLILTHFSARYQLFDDINKKRDNMGHIRAEVEAFCQAYANQFQQRFWLAEDFDMYQVTLEGVKKL